MLDEMTPEEFDQWIAYRTIEPDPVERIAEILKRGLVAVTNSWGGKLEPDMLDPKMDASGSSDMTPGEAKQVLASRLGPGRKGR
jgi:hypothetical protein